MNNPHEVLGLTPSATPEEIKAMYHRLARKYLDEAQAEDAALARIAERRMTELNAAYAFLSTRPLPAAATVLTTAATARISPSASPTRAPVPDPPTPSPTAPSLPPLFDAGRSHYVPHEQAARNILRLALESDIFDRQLARDKSVAKITRAQASRDPSRWLQTGGTYTGPELRAKIEALLAYALERTRGRAIGDKLTLIAFGLFAILIFAFDPEAGGNGEGAAYMLGFALAGGLILSLFWVYLPLKGLRWVSRTVFGGELGGSTRSWILQIITGGVLMLLISIGIVIEGAELASSLPGRGPNTMAPATPSTPTPTRLTMPVAVTVTQRTASGAPLVVEFRNTSDQSITIGYTRQNHARLYKGGGTFTFRPRETQILRDFEAGDLVMLEKDGYKTVTWSLK